MLAGKKFSRFGANPQKIVTLRYLALLLDAYGKHCLKLIILSRNCHLWTLVFLAEYRQNATSLQGGIWFTVQT